MFMLDWPEMLTESWTTLTCIAERKKKTKNKQTKAVISSQNMLTNPAANM